MGKASGGDRQNLGGIVGRFHVITAKHGGRAPIAVPKGAGQPGAGRRIKRLLGNGRRRKDEAGDEPKGSDSLGTLEAGESRGYEGIDSLCRMVILSLDV